MAVGDSYGGAVSQENSSNTGRSVLYGAGAGILGGIVFGMMMMLMMPMMMPMIGKIISMENLGGGWLYHLFNSAVIGAIFGLVVALARTSPTYAHMAAGHCGVLSTA